MTATSRKVSRKALAALLDADATVKALLPIGATVTAAAPVIKGQSPVVFVQSDGTFSMRRGIGQTKGINKFRLEIFVYVAAALSDTGYTPDTAADILDDLEAAIRAVILTNPTNDAWENIQRPADENEKTEIVHTDGKTTGGVPYDVEIIAVEVEIYDT